MIKQRTIDAHSRSGVGEQAGILEAIGASWYELRMIKQAGYHAGVNTFPDAIYQG